MYYILVCWKRENKRDQVIVSIHSSELEAFQELDRLEYKNSIEKNLASLKNIWYDTVYYDVLTCSKFISDGLSLEEQTQELDKLYASEIDEAIKEKNKRDLSLHLSAMLESETKRQIELAEIQLFISWWESHQEVFHAFLEEKEIRTIKILPTVKSYLRNTQDETICKWMRERFII